MGDVIDTFMRPFVGICQAGFVDPCRHGLNAKKKGGDCLDNVDRDSDWRLSVSPGFRVVFSFRKDTYAPYSFR